LVHACEWGVKKAAHCWVGARETSTTGEEGTLHFQHKTWRSTARTRGGAGIGRKEKTVREAVRAQSRERGC
jgi:hypothetical protein